MVNYVQTDTKNVVATHNSVLIFGRECSTFISLFILSNSSRTIFVQLLPNRTRKLHIPELKPLKLDDHNLYELNIVNHKMEQYSNDFDELIHNSCLRIIYLQHPSNYEDEKLIGLYQKFSSLMKTLSSLKILTIYLHFCLRSQLCRLFVWYTHDNNLNCILAIVWVLISPT